MLSILTGKHACGFSGLGGQGRSLSIEELTGFRFQRAPLLAGLEALEDKGVGFQGPLLSFMSSAAGLYFIAPGFDPCS